MVCFDSDILIDFLRKDAYAIKKISALRDKNIWITTTSINSFELLKGALKLNDEKLKETIHFLNNLGILNFDFAVSKKAAEIFNHLKSKGEMIDLADIMIAAIVISNKETLITRNVAHFNRIKELNLEKW